MSVVTLIALLTLTCQPATRARIEPVSAPQRPSSDTPTSKQELRKLYEAGKYQEVVKAVPNAAKANRAQRPELEYLAAQSYQKLGQWDEVRRIYDELASRGAKDAWTYVGKSGQALLNQKSNDAVNAAEKAVQLAPANPQAQYQLGMAESLLPDWAKAATAFQKAALVDPTFAYAHYYAAMSYFKLKRIDLMATHFEAFLKLAPDAPERPQVESIMKTVRGGR